ncbi:hypothetical protein Daus18300_009388 [Diaporthe australafricana]|uniref:Uncharacterized protein n=1 Tax=Diaporthe australafricana TaxID=127596 RepID=A0ABR3WEG0_9PEZI
MMTTSGHLNLGTTTSTLPALTPLDSTKPSSPDGGNAGSGDENTVPLPTSSPTGTESQITLSVPVYFTSTGGYLEIGPTSSTYTSPSSTPTSPGAKADPASPPVGETLSLKVQTGGVTVIRQTETWPSSKTTFARTTTDSGGHIVVQTTTADIPGMTSVLETSVRLGPDETLVAIPEVIPTMRGGMTQTMQSTYVDSEGHTTTSSYMTVIGGQSGFVTRTYFLATSLPSGYTVITVPTIVSTMEGGTIEALETTFVDGQGHLTTSLYTRTLHGTPASRTVPIVIATPGPPGSFPGSFATVIPTTIGGTTEIIKTTSTDSQGRLTTSSYTTVRGGTPTSMTVWTSIATPTSTSPTISNGTQNTDGVSVVVYGLSLRDYVLGAFLPTILAAIVAYPFKLININARLMQPFHALSTAREGDGTRPESSIFLRFYSWTGALSLPRSIKFGQPIIVISDLLVFGAALLAPVAAETVSVRVPDGCSLGCFGSLGVTMATGRVLEALAATMMALLIALIVLLNVFRWETGVSHNPWSIAGMASLSLDPGIRDIIRKIPQGLRGCTKENMMIEALAGSKYVLDEFWVSSNPESVSSRGYGIVVRTDANDAKKLIKNDKFIPAKKDHSKVEKKRTQPFVLLTWWGRCILLFVFACVLILLTYYENTSLNSGFEQFMDSRGFGVRFFFTALGVILGSCMETFFRCVAIILPYQQLSKHALPAERSILLSPPTNAFYGAYSAFQQRSVFLWAVSSTTILAELLLPVTLSHVPFSHLDTYETQLVCTWLSVTIMALMIIVVLYSFLIQWPHMPVDPRTVAGAMFYVCDSWMLGTMEGISTVTKKQRDWSMRSQRLRYEFGLVEGASGEQRIGVDMCGEMGEKAVMIRDERRTAA